MIKYLLAEKDALSNSYFVYDDESKKCLIIDLGAHFSQFERKAKELGLEIVAALLTHGHFDHVIGAGEAAERGIPIYVSKGDSHMLESAEGCLADIFAKPFNRPKSYQTISEGFYNFGGIAVEVIETPGHTKGSVCYRIGDILFSGDTLFKESYGRYDLPTGNPIELFRSVKILLNYPENLIVCPGHGETSSIDHERKYNPLKSYANQR